MASLQFHAQNIKCGGCASNIKNGLSTLQGVETVDVDVATGLVRITGADIEAQALHNKMSELGYPVVQD